jgi:hypothetical protein
VQLRRATDNSDLESRMPQGDPPTLLHPPLSFSVQCCSSDGGMDDFCRCLAVGRVEARIALDPCPSLRLRS